MSFQPRDIGPYGLIQMLPSEERKNRYHSQKDSGYWSLPSPKPSPEPSSRTKSVEHTEIIKNTESTIEAFSPFGVRGGLNIFLSDYSPKALEQSTPVITKETWDQLPLSPALTPKLPERCVLPKSPGLSLVPPQHTIKPVFQSEYSQSSQTRPFEPSFAAMLRNDPSPATLALIKNTYRSTTDPPCPPHLNTVVWVTNLPSGADVAAILSSVRCGKVVALHINPPTEGISTSACKIQFFTRASLLRFMQQAWSAAGVIISGRRVLVRENRHMRPPHRLTHQSRVVEIRGPAEIMATEYLRWKFEEFFEFQLEAVWEAKSDQHGRGVRVWFFGSLRAQAESAVMLVERHPEMREFEARFAEDPCADGRSYD